MVIHTFPVPKGMTPEEAWAEIQTFGCFPEYRWWKPRFWLASWASIEDDDDA